MRFRYARHTKDLAAMLDFYTRVAGLEHLGQFEAHDSYDGVFVGIAGQDWELEFTVSDESPGHVPDEDDLLVFYVHSEAEIEAITKRAVNVGALPVKAKNPYWNRHGLTLRDPDGFLVTFVVTFAIRAPKLRSGELSDAAIAMGISDWNALLEHVRSLPYGRNANRGDFALVLSEGKGSCSSKHALLKAIADENAIPAKLMIGIYKMSAQNTAIGNTLDGSGLAFIPEAHCYLKFGAHRFDFTNPRSSIAKIEPDIIEEIEIEPHQVAEFKVDFHRRFVRDWIASENLPHTFDEIWALRETCISELSKPENGKNPQI